MEMPFCALVCAFLLPTFFAGVPQAAMCQSKAAELTTIEGCLSKEPGGFIFGNGFGNERMLLTGNTAGLDSAIGDELSVTGRKYNLAKGSGPRQAIAVSSFRTILKKQKGGVQPQTGDRKSWSSFRSARYGVAMRYPSKWTTESRDQIQVSSNVVNDDGIEFLHAGVVPDDVFPGSNFVGGEFALVVDTGIENAGTCRQFGMAEEPVTTLLTAKGTSYTETDISYVAMAAVHPTYSLHTFQNGYCYEFLLELDEEDGTGMDLACSTQWVTTDNERSLLELLVSQILFTQPEVKHVSHRLPGLRPKVTSLRITPWSDSAVGTGVDVSWLAEGADYVQLRYPCTEGLYLNGMGGELDGEVKCGPATDANYPRNGSGMILLLNYNADSVPFALTVEPFRDGLACAEGAKTVTVDVPPNAHRGEPKHPSR